MTNFLVKHFVKNFEDTSDKKVRESYGKLSGVVGILCNVLLAGFKFFVGLLFKSVAVMADAANNFTDAMSSCVTFIGFKLSGKPADKEHPYGHERIEYLAGLIVSFLILFIGFELIKTSVSKIFSPEEVKTGILTFAVLFVSVLLKLWMFLFNRKIGKKIGSTVIMATAQDSLNDAIATSAVFISAVISHFTKINLDSFMGMAVSLYIIHSGINLVKDTADPLLGTAPSKELTNKITKGILNYDGVDGIHDLIIHNYGPNRCFASVHIEVCAKQDILISHDIADNIERDFKENMGVDLVVHLDPVIKDDETINVAKEMIDSILKKIDKSITFHDFRMVKGTTHSNLIFDVCIPADYTVSDKELVDMIINEVHLQNRDFQCVVTVDRNYN